VISVAQGRLLSEQEEANLLRLAQQQPESAGEFLELQRTLVSRAVEAALGDRRVTERLDGVRHRVVGGEPRVEKASEDGNEDERRLIEVGIYDYDRDVLVVPIVDLRTGSVVGIEERAGSQPPLTPEELEEARGIVSSDPQHERLGRDEGLQVAAFPVQFLRQDDPALGHRYFTLYFWTPGDEPERVGAVKVDLSTQRLVPLNEEELRALEA
jgi:hypothetical protein